MRRVAAGETVLIDPHGHAVVKLTRADVACATQRRLGFLKGKLTAPEDLNAPLPDDVIADFEGGN